MSASLKHVNEAIQKMFQDAGRFIYRGTGTMEFAKPQLSDAGHV